MRKLWSIALYTALGLGANAALAAEPAATLAGLRDGTLKKLVLHEAPAPVPDTGFETADGTPARLSDWKGKVVLVNFWATWCVPCRTEMPELDRLQAELGGADFQVVTIATGKQMPQAIDRFFAEAGVTGLPKNRDPKQALARSMAVLGLPVSVLIDRDGREVGRLTGEADWSSDSAKAIIAALIRG